jgi:hypothetical protein
MTTFAAGQKLTAAALELTTVTNRDGNATVGPSTSTTYTSTLTTSGTFTLAFTAPLSGKVKITVGARMWNSNANQHNYIAYALSGASTYTESDDDAAILYCDSSTAFPSEAYVEKTTLRTGLVVGGSYTITARYKTQGNTGNWAARLLVAQPVI